MLRLEFVEDPDVRSVSLISKLQGRGGDGRDLQIGRGIDSDIVLDSSRVPLLISRKHAVLSRRGHRLLLQDLGSTNGTFVNNLRLQEGELKPLSQGDVLSFGGAKTLRQAHCQYDEANPFVFTLIDIDQLFSHTASSHPSTSGLPQDQQNGAIEVIDLTDPNIESQIPLPPPQAAVHLRPVVSRKRTRQAHFSPPIDLDDFESDIDSSEDSEVYGRAAETKDSHAAAAQKPPAPPPLRAAAPVSAGAGPSDAASTAMLKALESQFECTICREFMVAVHSLVPCGHMFCGECICGWLQKKQSCPTCRASCTAAPVPSLKVDNMLEEVVAPQMDADSTAERGRKQASWAANSSQLAAKMQHLIKSSGSSLPLGPHLSQTHSVIEQLGPLMGYMEVAWGGVAPNPLPVRNQRRYRPSGRRNEIPPPPAPNPPQPPMVAAPGAPPPGAYSFRVLSQNAPRQVCRSCGSAILPLQVYIFEAGGANRSFHLHCERGAPGFVDQWRASRGALPGTNNVPSYVQARLRRHLTSFAPNQQGNRVW